MRARRRWVARTLRTGAAALVGVMACGWGAAGHRTITLLALDSLPETAPAWFTDAGVRAQAAYQSNEPDRWRGVRTEIMGEENSPEHYIDAELLPEGMTLGTLPELRYTFVARLVEARVGTEDEGASIEFDAERVGFLPYAIAEHYAKLVSSFRTMRILERLDDPAREEQLEAARANAIREMGQLSHFVGDAGQPLHTTIHFNGWVGDNPAGYTTSRRFHAEIDSGVVRRHALNLAGLAPYRKPMAEVAGDGAFEAGVALIGRSFAKVEPLYELEKSGELHAERGKAFIAERMADAASVLAGLFWSAWRAAEPEERDISDFVRYNDFGEEKSWGS